MRRLFVVLFALGLLWTLAVALSGGFILTVGAFRLSSRSPLNPALATGLIALVAWTLAGAGRRKDVLASDWSLIVDTVTRSPERRLKTTGEYTTAQPHWLTLVLRAGLNLLLVLTLVMLAIHVATWWAAVIVIAKSFHLPPIQSYLALACSALFLVATDRLRRRQRIAASAASLLLFGVLSVAVPLNQQFANTGFMGDGADYAENRDKFDNNIPFAAGDPQIHFKGHLADAFLGAVDLILGRTETSPAIAYRLLSHVGGLLFIGELVLVLVLSHWSRRACRYVGLAMATPVVISYFAFYETGYLAATAGAFPLLMQSIRGRLGRGALGANEGSAIIQGIHTAFHGFGLLGLAGGGLAALRARSNPFGQAFRYGMYALAAYLIWLVFYIVVFKITVAADTYSANIALRQLETGYYFDRRMVHPLLSWNGIAEIGAASVAVGVPMLLLALWQGRSLLERHAALLYALPGLMFLIVWWPSPGVSRDMDLLLSAFAGMSGAIWISSRTPRAALQAWLLLVAVHIAFWTIVADRTLERIWLT